IDTIYHVCVSISFIHDDSQHGSRSIQLGAYSGSLVYANKNNPTEAEVTGSYLGIGLDAYGNFARNSEGKNGGPSGLSPNSIVFRGPTTDNSDNPTNRYLQGVTILQ